MIFYFTYIVRLNEYIALCILISSSKLGPIIFFSVLSTILSKYNEGAAKKVENKKSAVMH